jgi:hypothetical protein
MSTLAKSIVGWFNGFRRSRRRLTVPKLASLRLSDHDLEDLNLPCAVRAKFEVERACENKIVRNIYR